MNRIICRHREMDNLDCRALFENKIVTGLDRNRPAIQNSDLYISTRCFCILRQGFFKTILLIFEMTSVPGNKAD